MEKKIGGITMAFRLEFLALLILLLVPHIGVAEETLPDISNMSEDELDKLPQETIERLPMKEVMAKYFGDELIIDYMVDVLPNLSSFISKACSGYGPVWTGLQTHSA